MGIPDHLICLLRNLYADQEATVRNEHATMDWFKIGKGVQQGCMFSPCLFNLHAEYIMQNAELDEAQAGINTAGEISITLNMQMILPLWQKAEDLGEASGRGCCCSVAQSLEAHRLQHARLPCPSPSPGACSNSCPWSW